MASVIAAESGKDSPWVSGLLADYGRWLDRQRGLAPVTVRNYCCQVEGFLAWLCSPAPASVDGLDAGMVTGFMVEFCRERNTNSAKSMGRSLRSFLRFAHVSGLTRSDLSGAVPSSAGWYLASLPKAVPAADVERLLAMAAIRAQLSATGRRDHAVLLLLARLGLRRGEVAGLQLDHIDWRAGEVTVVGKASRVERLPLPVEAGEAIVAWLSDGRPACQTRSVFTTLHPPGRSLTGGAVGHIVRSTARLSGIAPIGAHQLRHTLATDMLREGGTLAEVGQVLRHRSARSTAIYAKVDQVALRPLARPWPGSEPPAATGAQRAAGEHLVRPWPGCAS